MKEKIGASLDRLINYICLVIPLLIAFFCCIIATFSSWDQLGWNDHTRSYFFIPNFNAKFIGIVLFLLSVLFILASVWMLKKFEWNGEKDKIWKTLTAFYIFLTAILCRTFYLLLANTKIEPFSDFANIWHLANGNYDNIVHDSLFAAWINFANFEHLFISCFGNNYKLFIVFNIFASSISAVVLFEIVNMVFPKDRVEDISAAAGLLYAIYPSSAVFALNAAPDIYVVPLYLIALYFLLKCDEKRKGSSYSSIIYAIIAGAFCGWSSSYKSFAVVLIIAYFIASIIDFLLAKEINRRKLLIFAICFFCIIGTNFIVKKTALLISERTFSIHLDYNTATSHYLLVGLNTEGEGQIHIGTLSRKYYEYVLDGMNVHDAEIKARELLKNDWHNNSNKIIPLFIKKTIWAWQDDIDPINYYMEYNSSDSFGFSILKLILPSTAQIIYLMILINSIIGIISLLKIEYFNSGVTLCCLIVIGYYFVVLISEAQSRYKYLIMPILCILAAIGISSVIKGSEKLVCCMKKM